MKLTDKTTALLISAFIGGTAFGVVGNTIYTSNKLIPEIQEEIGIANLNSYSIENDTEKPSEELIDEIESVLTEKNSSIIHNDVTYWKNSDTLVINIHVELPEGDIRSTNSFSTIVETFLEYAQIKLKEYDTKIEVTLYDENENSVYFRCDY